MNRHKLISLIVHHEMMAIFQTPVDFAKSQMKDKHSNENFQKLKTENQTFLNSTFRITISQFRVPTWINNKSASQV